MGVRCESPLLLITYNVHYAERGPRIPLDEHSLEEEHLNRALNRETSDHSPGRTIDPHLLQYFALPPEVDGGRYPAGDPRDPDRHQQRPSLSSSPPGGDVTSTTHHISPATRISSTPRYLHSSQSVHAHHAAPSSFQALDPRRRETRALGPRPISRDAPNAGTTTGWNSESPRIDLADRSRTHLHDRPRPWPIPRVAPRASSSAGGPRVDRERPFLTVNLSPEIIAESRNTRRNPLLPYWRNMSPNTSPNTSSSPSPSRMSESPWLRSSMPTRQGSTNTRANTNTSPFRSQPISARPVDRHPRTLMGQRPLRHERNPSSSSLMDHAVNLDDLIESRRARENFSSNASSVDRTGLAVTPPLASTRNHATGRSPPDELATDMYARLVDRLQQDFHDSRATIAATLMDEESSPSSSEFPAHREDFFALPSVPSPGLGGLFDHNNHQDGHDPVNEAEQNRRRSSAPSPPLRYRSAPSLSPFSLRRRSPSPTREEQATRIPQSLRSRSPPHGSGPGAARLNPQSFTPGPFRNTMQRVYEMNIRHENTENRPTAHRNNAPSIPPLSFEESFSPTRDGLSSSRQEESSNSPRVGTSFYLGDPSLIVHDQVSREVWNEPTPSSESNRLSSAEVADRYDGRDWWERPLPRQPRRSVPRPATAGPGPSPRFSQPRQAVDVHTVLSRHQRMEATRIADSADAPTSSSQNSPVRDGDVEGFSHAIDVLRHDGLSSPRSRQLIYRYREEREQAQSNAETVNPSSVSSSSSPWGVFDTWARSEDRVQPPPRVRGARVPSAVGESESTRYRDSWEADRETMRQRRGRFPGHHGGLPVTSVFPSGGPLREYLGRLGRRGRALGDYVVRYGCVSYCLLLINCCYSER